MHLFTSSTVEDCLGYSGAKSIALIGAEAVDGTSAWHVRIETKYDETIEFWISVADPDRVLKHSERRGVVTCAYNDARSPIPTHVTVIEHKIRAAGGESRFTRSNSAFNIHVDPASFTLAGLNMPAGTAVSDNRNHRRIGYWTGKGLSENLPSKKSLDDAPAPTLAEMMSVLATDPDSPRGFDAASWILFNTPDGAEVETAAQVIEREHVRGTNLVAFCQELERVRHRCSKPLLRTILDRNPSSDVQATACFLLGEILKDESKYGQDKKIAAEAEQFFNQVISRFSHSSQKGREYTPRATADLNELRRLSIGKPAPEIDGKDLDGQSMKLSDYREKVVVLTFWGRCGGCRPDMAEYRKLLECFTTEQIAILGVYADDKPGEARAIAEKLEMSWPSFRDSRDGPISKTWNIGGWPTVYVLDRNGVIRQRGHAYMSLVNAVEPLLRN